MSSYRQLTSLVESDDLRLINMVAVPRSMSTALGRALNEAEEKSLFINEPFNRNNRSLEIAAQYIVAAALPVLEQDGNPVTIFTKNMAAYLGKGEFRDLAAIAIGNVWSIRHPLTQIGSLLTRMANDIAIENGADRISQSTVGPYLATVAQQLEDSAISKNFSRTGWENISHHFKAQKPEAFIVIDGTELTIEPHSILRKAALVLGLNYTPKMADGWRDSYININRATRLDTESNGWTSHAATSRGITPASREPIQLEDLPLSLREHIVNVAIPTYETMLQARMGQI